MGLTMLKNRMGRVATVAAAAVAALTLGTGAANALYVSDYTTAANIRSGPYTNSSINGIGYPGHGTNDWCFTNGSTVNGWSYWDSNTDRNTGVWGYTHEDYISGARTGQTTRC
ncbi:MULTISPECIES: hypothetical protein [Streptomycetaceae]|uniref:hypothetical protein n=2 Tax=Kitasatosporales TaxID=85011 RepID=UPI000939ACC8|nr:hypothetical protein [Streptomyces sp. CB02056]OKI08935.1 hypothetical protein AMK13_11295 [Streptomyces sp. CB02056]